MNKYSYSPPKIKTSTKLTNVLSSEGQVVCSFRRNYSNLTTRIADCFLDFNDLSCR
ncbi:tubby C-terminal domain-like protein [Paenibacillus sp. 481]|uniref:tubby C-terminal domain-like protein n=1 Tax=Paenibacillus sp. 481 TaxID=2835869 RepID=UPI003FA6EE47